METVFISAEDTVQKISESLQQEFPDTVFAVRLEDPLLSHREVCGVDIIWIDGPSRDRVEDVVDRFQGVTWNPQDGTLQGRSHLMIDPNGELVRVCYNIDYIFCDGHPVAVCES